MTLALAVLDFIIGTLATIVIGLPIALAAVHYLTRTPRRHG